LAKLQAFSKKSISPSPISHPGAELASEDGRVSFPLKTTDLVGSIFDPPESKRYMLGGVTDGTKQGQVMLV